MTKYNFNVEAFQGKCHCVIQHRILHFMHTIVGNATVLLMKYTDLGKITAIIKVEIVCQASRTSALITIDPYTFKLHALMRASCILLTKT